MKDIERIEELKHNEELLYRLIEYLISLWGISEKDKIVEKFKNVLRFTDEDIERLGFEDFL